MSCLNDCKQTVSRVLPISATELRWQSTPRVCWTPISGRKFPCQSLTGVVRLPTQTMAPLREKKPSKLPYICIKFDSHPKTTGIFFMIPVTYRLQPTNSTSPMGFSWNFHWKHFPYLFRMKSYHWQKMNNSFKIVAKTVKLVPLQKKTFLGGEISKKKNFHHQKTQQQLPTTPPRFQFIGMFHLQLCL